LKKKGNSKSVMSSSGGLIARICYMMLLKCLVHAVSVAEPLGYPTILFVHTDNAQVRKMSF